ncbi:MAG: hypothetical protein Q4G09_08390 [Clostridia bacterium]|nr:hypothetical protein [Clostridia bacterium]
MKLKKSVLSMMVVSTIGLSSITAYAASTKSFTYDFKHMLAVSGKQKATQTKAHFSCTTTSNGGSDTYFTIKQYKSKFFGDDEYLDSDTIKCGVDQTDTCSFETAKGTKYEYEFWKPTAMGYIVGSGTLEY